MLSSQETGKYDQEVDFHDVENQDFVNPKSHEEKYISRRATLFRFQVIFTNFNLMVHEDIRVLEQLCGNAKHKGVVEIVNTTN